MCGAEPWPKLAEASYKEFIDACNQKVKGIASGSPVSRSTTDIHDPFLPILGFISLSFGFVFRQPFPDCLPHANNIAAPS